MIVTPASPPVKRRERAASFRRSSFCKIPSSSGIRKSIVPCFLASIQGRIERATTITPISAARNSASTIKAHTKGATGWRTWTGCSRSASGRIEDWLTDSLEELSSPNGGWADQRLADTSGGPSDQRSLPARTLKASPHCCRRRAAIRPPCHSLGSQTTNQGGPRRPCIPLRNTDNVGPT